MFKKILFPVAFAALFFTCKNDPKPDNFQAVDANQPMVPENATPSEKLKATAIDESNYMERVRSSFIPLQEEYRKANGKVPGIGEVNVFVDDNFVLLIENTHGGHTYQTKVNLKNLNGEQGGLMLIPDRNPGEFPGLKILVLDGRNGVEIIKDDKLVREARQLEIFLADRTAIERVTPAIVQALNVVNGKVPD